VIRERKKKRDFDFHNIGKIKNKKYLNRTISKNKAILILLKAEMEDNTWITENFEFINKKKSKIKEKRKEATIATSNSNFLKEKRFQKSNKIYLMELSLSIHSILKLIKANK
jgi:hypothetical protein